MPLLQRSPAAPDQTTTNAVYFNFNVPKHGFKSRARWEDGKFIVEAGSLTYDKWASTAALGYLIAFDIGHVGF